MPTSRLAKVLVVGGLAVLLAGVVAAAWLYLSGSQSIESGGLSSSGKANVGGPFELVDQTGTTRTAEDFRGKYMLIYFGFTYCPDVCPTSLSVMSQALDQLEKSDPQAAGQIVPVFITVDPERDTVETMADYVQHFHEDFVALTGSPSAIREAAKEYKVYYQKVEDDSASAYLVDHTSIYYLMGPEGKYVTHFSHGTAAESMAKSLEKLVGKEESA